MSSSFSSFSRADARKHAHAAGLGALRSARSVNVDDQANVYIQAYRAVLRTLITGSGRLLTFISETDWLIYQAAKSKSMDGITNMLLEESLVADEYDGRNIEQRLRLMSDELIARIDFDGLGANPTEMAYLVDALALVKAERKKAHETQADLARLCAAAASMSQEEMARSLKRVLEDVEKEVSVPKRAMHAAASSK